MRVPMLLKSEQFRRMWSAAELGPHLPAGVMLDPERGGAQADNRLQSRNRKSVCQWTAMRIGPARRGVLMGKTADRAIEITQGFVQFAFANNGSPDFITL